MSIQIELARSQRRRYEQRPWWVERDQIRRVLGPPDPHQLAQLIDDRNTPLAWGLYSPESPLAFRALSLRHPEGLAQLADSWLEQRLECAWRARDALTSSGQTTAARIVNSEGDGLPGLTWDRYGTHHVLALSTAPMLARKPQIEAFLDAQGHRHRTWLFPVAALEREGVTGIPTPHHDAAPPNQLNYLEDGLTMIAPAPPSQKTGAYLDQRDNRRRFADLLAPQGGILLDVGSHIGGFSLQAARAGLRCIAIDQSETVLRYVVQNAELNGLSARIETRAADMFGDLHSLELPQRVDGIVFDPPKVARHPQERKKAMKAMTRTVHQLWARLRPGGLFAICSCSHHLGYEHLDEIILRAASAAQGSTPALHSATQIARWGPGVDHPVPPCHEPGHYLRVAVYRKS